MFDYGFAPSAAVIPFSVTGFYTSFSLESRKLRVLTFLCTLVALALHHQTSFMDQIVLGLLSRTLHHLVASNIATGSVLPSCYAVLELEGFL